MTCYLRYSNPEPRAAEVCRRRGLRQRWVALWEGLRPNWSWGDGDCASIANWWDETEVLRKTFLGFFLSKVFCSQCFGVEVGFCAERERRRRRNWGVFGFGFWGWVGFSFGFTAIWRCVWMSVYAKLILRLDTDFAFCSRFFSWFIYIYLLVVKKNFCPSKKAKNFSFFQQIIIIITIITSYPISKT